MATATKAAAAKKATAKKTAGKTAAAPANGKHTEVVRSADGTPNFTPHDGHPVLSTTIKITKAGDGLSKAVKVDPVELHHGEIVMIALECEVGPIAYDPIKDTDGLMRVHTLKTLSATLVDEATVAAALTAQKQRIEAAAGVMHLDFGAGGAPPAERPEGMSDEEWEASGGGDDGSE